MTTAYALSDTRVMIARCLRRSLRDPEAFFTALMLPVVLMLLFVYVFGGAVKSGGTYADYVVPGLIVLCAGFGAGTTAVAVAVDMSSGIIARFRTMAIARVSVLTGHVLGSMILSLLGIAFVIGIAVAMGFRTSADPLSWLAVAGLLVLITFAITWLAVALGLVSGSAETASNLPMFLMLLPFLGSGFVPTHTMPVGLRWFAEYQPFTPVIQTVRGLLADGPIGNNAIMAIGWGAGIAALSYLWARRLYRRPMQAK